VFALGLFIVILIIVKVCAYSTPSDPLDDDLSIQSVGENPFLQCHPVVNDLKLGDAPQYTPLKNMSAVLSFTTYDNYVRYILIYGLVKFMAMLCLFVLTKLVSFVLSCLRFSGV